MEDKEEKTSDLYAVLGLKKECSAAELRIAYKKLALRWHPDRCAASGDSKYLEDAKRKFQAIQEAYSVLSDANKRLLYDVGIYDRNDDDDKYGMGEFLKEMVAMMSESKSNETEEDSFEDLKGMFEEIFLSDNEAFGSSTQTETSSSCSSTLFATCDESSNVSNTRYSSETTPGGSEDQEHFAFDDHNQSFCLGTSGVPGRQAKERRRSTSSRKGRK